MELGNVLCAMTPLEMCGSSDLVHGTGRPVGTLHYTTSGERPQAPCQIAQVTTLFAWLPVGELHGIGALLAQAIAVGYGLVVLSSCLRGITCPTDRIPARAQTQQTATAGATLSLRTVATAEVEPDTVVVQVVLGDPSAQFGAVTLELDYDPALFAVEGCTENPTGALDLASCNGTYEPGVVRFNGIVSAGSVDGASLVAVRFTRLAATTADLITLFALRADGVFDQAGEDLAWSNGAEPPTPTPDATAFKVFMPAVTSQGDRADAPSTDGTEALSPLPALSYLVHLRSDDSKHLRLARPP